MFYSTVYKWLNGGFKRTLLDRSCQLKGQLSNLHFCQEDLFNFREDALKLPAESRKMVRLPHDTPGSQMGRRTWLSLQKRPTHRHQPALKMTPRQATKNSCVQKCSRIHDLGLNYRESLHKQIYILITFVTTKNLKS